MAPYPVLLPPVVGEHAEQNVSLAISLGAHLREEIARAAIFAKVAGLDVHQKFITVVVRCRLETGKLLAEVRTFTTMTRDLLAWFSYLEALGVAHMAMESNGVLWKPVWNILEGRFELLLVDPQHVKQVPDRKSDLGDAEWIARCCSAG